MINKKDCQYCGVSFSVRIQRGPKRKYCSEKCRRSADIKRKKDGLCNRVKYNKLCEKCFMCFETYRPEQRYCSNLCFCKRYELSRRYCIVCNKPFSPSGIKPMCCSTGCAKIKEGNTKRIYLVDDPRPVISKAVCDGIYKSLKHNGGSKRGRKWESLVDFTKDDIIRHLEKQFTDGMSWDNYGDWHIDHKIPISAHNFKNTKHQDFKRCWSLKNLQPMWASENISKGAKLEKHFQPGLTI